MTDTAPPPPGRRLSAVGALAGAGRWLRAAAGVLAAMAVLAAAPAAPAAEPAPLLPLDEAHFERQLGAGGGVVALPHDWRGLDLPLGHVARYRLRFDVPAGAEAQPWALWSPRLPLVHRIRLNGHLLSDQWDLGSATAARTAPGGAELPPILLRAGVNEVEIDERGGQRAGLGRVWVGPAEPVHGVARVHRRWTTDLPRALNGASTGAALFSLLLWLRRRSERTAAWFGLFALLISLRNMAYVEPGSPTPAGGSLLLYAMTCTVSLLFAGFAASMAETRSRWLRWGISALAVLAVLGAGWSQGDAARLDRLRVWLYPGLLAVAMPAVALLVRAAWRRTHRHTGLLGLTALVLLASGLHDYLLQVGRIDPGRDFLFPWTAPLLALAYALVMGGRIAQALTRSERYGEQLEAEVRARTHDLQEANEAKSRFLAAASHDLRQPLVAIGLLVGLLKEHLAEGLPRRLIGRIDEAVAAMERLLRGLLDLSRLEAGAHGARREPVHLAPLLQAVVADAQALAQQRGLSLRLRVSPRAAVAWTDPLLVEQTLRNLVANAVRYTARGGVLVAVRGWRGQVLVQVWDTGPGIPEPLRERIFEDFVQGDNAHRDRQQGLGLGLAIVRRATRALGTQVQLASRPGRGSCFAVALPRVDGAQPTHPPVPPAAVAGASDPAPPPTPAPALAGRCAWVVEDATEVREALVDRLRGWGARVQAFGSAEALVAAWTGGSLPRPDLLVSDVRLPGADGLTLVRRLRADEPGLPVLMLTGNTAPQDLQALAAAGLPVLHKPFRAEALADALAALATGREPP